MEERFYPLSAYKALLERNNLLLEDNLTEEGGKKKIRCLSYNSAEVEFGTLFVCKGAHFSPKYLQEALNKGAIAYVSETRDERVGGDIPYLLVKDIRTAMAKLADFFYHQPWKQLELIGITGTKGKSTTAYFMRAILDDYLKEMKKPASGIISGIDNYDGVITEESHLTTPEAMMFHRHMANAVNSGIEYLTMEVSSQALKYQRTLGVTYDIGCFLNIGNDHISDIEHPDIQDYIEAKMILFSQCKTAVVNKDSSYCQKVLDAAKEGESVERILTFGMDEGADIVGYDVVPGKRGIRFKAKSDSFDEEFKIGLTGLFNVSNALAAITMAYGLNIPLANIKAGLKKAKVSGRMEVFTNKAETLTVIVDYAHNQMSFNSLFESTKKEYPEKKIIIVFGCPGKKALGRRKELGDIAGKYADLSILTEEDAGEEPVAKISEEIAAHIKAQGGNYELIPDREEAIKRAIEKADDHTVILLTGKGRETRQKRGTEYIDTPSDVDYVEKYLAKK